VISNLRQLVASSAESLAWPERRGAAAIKLREVVSGLLAKPKPPNPAFEVVPHPSSGGVMGKMIDAQSIVVASTATNWYGHEGSILRHVFLHSIVLACLVGLLVTLQAYVYPFTMMVLK
jgi:L-lactate permease